MLAAFVPLDYLWDLVSIGTLIAFIVVSLGVIILRYREPDLPRGFKVPGYPVTPILSILACAYILFGLHWYTWVIFAGWVGRLPGVLHALRPQALGAGARSVARSPWWRRSDGRRRLHPAPRRPRRAGSRPAARPRPRRGDGGGHRDPAAVADAVHGQDRRRVRRVRPAGRRGGRAAGTRLPARHQRRGRDHLPGDHGAVGVVRARRDRAGAGRQHPGDRVVRRRARGADRDRRDGREAAALLPRPAGDRPARLPARSPPPASPG